MVDTVTVYRWDDVDAPQITNGTPSEYIAVLKACLVDGYGSKTGAGWTIAEQDTGLIPYIAFRNSSNPGSALEVYAVDNDDAGSNFRARAHIDYIDRNNVGRTYPFYTMSRNGTGINLLDKWIVFATSKALFFWVTMPSRTENYFGTFAHISFWCGKFESYYQNDAADFSFIACKDDANFISWDTNAGAILGFTESLKLNLYPVDGGSTKAYGSPISPLGKALYIIDNTIANSAPDEISVLADIHLIAGSNDGLASATNKNYFNSDTMPYLRARLPGFYATHQGAYRTLPMPHFKQINGKQHFQIPNPHTYGSLLWLNCEEW